MACPRCRKVRDLTENCRVRGVEMKDVKSPLAGLRFHDLRHHAITELSESQTSDSIIMAIAGHVRRSMLAHYSHVRQDAKRDAVNVLSARRPITLTMQDYDTKAELQEEVPSYVVENNGRDD